MSRRPRLIEEKNTGVTRARLPGGLALLLTLALAAVAWGGLETPVVFCRLPVESAPAAARAGGMLRADYGNGAQLTQLFPDGSTRQLAAGFASACDPDVSFDGESILFAGKPRPSDPWSIWELTPQGREPRQVVALDRDCRSPVYLSTLYTITSREPWYTVLFACEDGVLNEAGDAVATSLYTVRLDGSELRRVTFAPGGDFDPYLMRDGQLLFAGRRLSATAKGSKGRVSLFGIFSDGIDYSLYGGRQGGSIQHMPTEVGDGSIVFVEAEEVGWDGAGHLAAVSTRRPHHSYRRLTDDGDGLFHSPSPLPGGDLLVSWRHRSGGTHGLYRYRLDRGGLELLYDDPGSHELHGKLLAPRPEPDGRSSTVRPESPTGKLYALDIRQSDPDFAGRLDPAEMQRIRVLEAVPSPGGDEAAGDDTPIRPAPMAARLLGEAPVEADGSFHFDLPADLPVKIQLLDRDGMAVADCDWIWVKQREYRGCIGCHEDPELTPPNRFVDAAARPANQLTLPPERRRTVAFLEDILPIVRIRCSTCHGEHGTSPNLAGEPEEAYKALMAEGEGDPGGGSGSYVEPGTARTSYLIWLLFGRDTSRPWDQTEAREVPADHAGLLEELERRTFVEWIDLGAQWDLPAARAEGVDE